MQLNHMQSTTWDMLVVGGRWLWIVEHQDR